jgi:hypothetical protein
MHVFRTRQHVDTNMKTAINILLKVCLVGFGGFAYAQETFQYSFKSNMISKDVISFVYKNESNEAHCIQAADFSFKLLGDALYVRSASSGEPMKYVGPLGKQGAVGTQDFIILPPSEYTTSSIRITDFYKLKREGVYVSYSMPVILCKYLMEKYVSMPLPGFMRLKINDPLIEKTDVYAKDYPEWTQFGFIAVSKPLLIDN